MIAVTPLQLQGPHARLEPLAAHHHDDLVEAVRDGELWNLWYTFIPTPDRMQAEIERRLQLQAQGSMVPFAVIEPASGQAVGMTTYMNIDAAHHRVEIGSTWYRRRVQRSALNTQCKRLLLSHAFDTLGCIAVEFRTHWFNHDSRHAIERLGAKLDGVLRSHQIAPNGSLRDTAVYSIIASEWPAVRSHLDYQLARPRPAP
ncbi:MAG: GNAT family N-acetyltransferase [Limnohabitans sp.]|jgi:RimJ/RimL family protein N-acetyltransferase|nr:N-acetyltransferase [Betaproteobacteria bacterium]